LFLRYKYDADAADEFAIMKKMRMNKLVYSMYLLKEYMLTSMGYKSANYDNDENDKDNIILRMNLMMEVIKMMMVGLISILFMQEQI
jgi:hypothetical protein